MNRVNVLLCGVGGQGILLASNILADAALNAGYDVKQSEVHGMAQRGGSVVSGVCFGEKVYSPIICEQGADYILALERLEALRNLLFLKRGGCILISDQKLIPLSVSTGKARYPEDIQGFCQKKAKEVRIVPALKIAQELGNSRIVNIIMLGVLCSFLAIPKEILLKSIQTQVPSSMKEVNIAGFIRGYSFFQDDY